MDADYDSDHSGPKPPPQQPAADTTPHSEHILHSHAPKEELGGDEDGVPGDVAVGGRSGSGSAKSAKDAEKLGRKASLQRCVESCREICSGCDSWRGGGESCYAYFVDAFCAVCWDWIDSWRHRWRQ